MTKINVNVVIATLGAILIAAMLSEKFGENASLYAAAVFICCLIGCFVGHKRDADAGAAAIVGALVGVIGAPLLVAILLR